MYNISDKQIRELALEILDDGEGVSTDAWRILHPILESSGNEDIIRAIDGVENRVFLKSNHPLKP